MKLLSINSETSNKIGLGAFLCALEIAAFHAPGAWAKLTPQSEFLYNAVGPLTQASLAFFFTVSGFFVFGKVDDIRSYGQLVLKRSRTLLVPFVLWNLIFLGCVMLMFSALKGNVGLQCFSSLMPGGGGRWLQPDIWSFVRNCPNPVLWFLRTLFVLVIIAPLLSIGVKRTRIVLPIVLGIVCLLVEALHIATPAATLVQPRSVFYFTLGMWWRSANREMPLGRLASVILAVAGYLLAFVSPVGHLLQMTGYYGLVPAVARGRCLQSFAFPLYSVHYLMIWVFLYLNARYTLVRTGSLAWVLSAGGFAIVSSLLIITVLRKLLPRTCFILFGGR